MSEWVPLARNGEMPQQNVIALAEYTIVRAVTMEEDLYLAFKLDEKPSKLIGRFTSIREAQSFCERDAQSRKGVIA